MSSPAAGVPDLPGSEAITQSSKSNLALSFAALPPERRRAMTIFYAFCRVVDDVADSTELPVAEKQRQLGEWREEIRRAYLDEPRTPLGRELAQVIRTYLIPPTPLEEILNGVEMDQAISRYPDFALLEKNTATAWPARSAWSASRFSVVAIPVRAITPWRSAWPFS